MLTQHLMKTLVALAISTATCPLLMMGQSPAPVPLGSAANYGVLAGSTVTNTGPSILNSKVGVSPGSAVTGFPPGTAPVIEAATPPPATAQLDLTVAYNDAAGRPGPPIAVSGNIGGQTLVPGIYKSTSTLAISSGDLTLDGQGNPNAVFIFQIASGLTTTTNRQVILVGGARAANVFWQVGSSATIGTFSAFKGNILALASVSLATGATLEGRALARSGAVTLDSNVILAPVQGIVSTPDFGISAFPSLQTVSAGLGTSYNVLITPLNGFTGTVAFTATGLPAGAAATFTPLTVAGSGSTILSVTTSAITPTGVYPITITGTSGALTHQTLVTLVVTTGADFQISSSPPSQTVAPGTGTSYNIPITPLNGFTGTVAFAASGLPAGAAATFSPLTVAGSGSTTMSVTTSVTTPVGSYPITVTGNSGGLTHSTIVTLVVTSGADFQISALPPSQSVAAGISTSYSVLITPLNGFTGTVAFTATGLPAGAAATFNPATVADGSGSTTMNVTTSATTPLGSYSITVTGTSGSLTHSAPVTLVVTSETSQIGGPLVCTSNAGVPPVVRAEGHTELVGDIILVCTGGDPNRTLTANFQLFLNTNITSRLIGAFSEALLMIDEPGAARLNRAGAAGVSTPFCVSPDTVSNSAPAVLNGTSNVNGLPVGGISGTGTTPNCNGAVSQETYQQGTYTVFRGQPAAAGNGVANAAVVWPGVPITPPGRNQARTIRITNVRANASGLPASASLVPSQIFAFISISASQSLALENPQQAVAFVLPGLQFDVRSCSGGGGAPFTFLQCASQSADLFTNPNAAGPFRANLGVRFREGFQTAFKTRIETAQLNSIPGVVFNTESGFVRPELGSVGVADTATRVRVTFNNIPEGVRLFVSTNSVTSTATSEIGTSTAQAVLVSTDANGAGGSVGTSGSVTPVGVTATTTLSCVTDAPAAEVTIGGTGTNRSGMAVWEVTTANSATIDTLFFYVGVAYNSNTPNNLPGLGTSSVTGSFAPFYAISSNAGSASSTLPIPRFVDNASPQNDFIINQCVTNLLFPFVTNQAGFDTGIAISNTSRDVFGSNASRVQAGTCTLNYYGGAPSGPAPAPQTSTANVESGGQLLFVLSTGGNLGISATPGFQGYIIAQCRFQYGHGFAFISDGPIGQARVAEGYLALVMDGGIGSRTGSFSEVLSH